MSNIESSGLPLAFKIRGTPAASLDRGDEENEDRVDMRVQARALEGMQKEAVVSSNSGSSWRVVSDEGPYLNGTDLAPFPLAFFTAGMQFSYLSELLGHAAAHGISLKSVELWQDNYYTMEGSALKGTMLGGAKPAGLKIKITANSPGERIRRLIRQAEASSPAEAMVREVLANTFSLNFNGRSVPVTGVNPSTTEAKPHSVDSFDSIQSADETEFLPGIISKTDGMDRVFEKEGGAGSSLQADQKRTLHIHGQARALDGTLMEATIQAFKPIGSAFRFLCDGKTEGGEEKAPPPLAYLSAGVGFCYMTQIGRYAHITKQDLRKYEVVQENVFTMSGSADDWSRIARAYPTDTQVFLEAGEPDETAQKTVSMGERTCFLHAAMRGSCPSVIKVELNGQEIGL